MKVSTYLLLVLLIQSCIPQKTLQKKDVSLQRAPELNRPARKDIAEVEIFVKEVSPKDRKKDINSDRVKPLITASLLKQLLILMGKNRTKIINLVKIKIRCQSKKKSRHDRNRPCHRKKDKVQRLLKPKKKANV